MDWRRRLKDMQAVHERIMNTAKQMPQPRRYGAQSFYFPAEGEQPMTMAPGRKKRGFWIEIIFISILLFLLMGSRAQRMRLSSGPHADFTHGLSRGLNAQPVVLK